MPIRKILTASTTAVTLALTGVPIATLTAQSAAAQETQEYSAQELDAFTVALIEVAGLRHKYTQLLQSAESGEQQAAIAAQANAAMAEAIEQTEGMTVDSYLEIAQAASEDQALNQRIVKRVQAQDEKLQ